MSLGSLRKLPTLEKSLTATLPTELNSSSAVLNVITRRRSTCRSRGLRSSSWHRMNSPMPQFSPVFLASLPNVHAPKSCQNVANNIKEFLNLVERFGSDGPGMRTAVEPESIKAQLTPYKQTLDKPARQWRNTQVLLDFQGMPSQTELKEVRSKVINLTETLIEKGLNRGHLVDEDFLMLLKGLVCLVVMRNACRVSSGIYIKNEHYMFRCKGPQWKNYKSPLCPPNQIVRKP